MKHEARWHSWHEDNCGSHPCSGHDYRRLVCSCGEVLVKSVEHGVYEAQAVEILVIKHRLDLLEKKIDL